MGMGHWEWGIGHWESGIGHEHSQTKVLTIPLENDIAILDES
jgi:hypothetical protein